jgi:hypothetical protein
MKNYSIGLISGMALLALSACSQKPSAQKIIDQSISFYGMDKLNGKTISLDFRTSHFILKHDNGNFFYEKSFKDDSLGNVKDQLSNLGFVREINGLVKPLIEKDSLKYAASVNSMVYFTLLPLKLNDGAVLKKYLKTVSINGKEFDKIEIRFNPEKGGKHHNDVFYFWFDQDDHSMDYFAYSEGGNRFRAVKEIKEAGSLKLQDYNNYESAKGEKTPLVNYDKLFEENKLVKLSEIIIENIKVE